MYRDSIFIAKIGCIVTVTTLYFMDYLMPLTNLNIIEVAMYVCIYDVC